MISLKDAEIITAEDAHHVLWYYGRSARKPGSFTYSLITAINRADSSNEQRLARGFPGLVAAMIIVKRRSDGLDILDKIATGTFKKENFYG